MAEAARPYFPALVVGDQPVAFAHLEPFKLQMATQARPDGLMIDVRFTNHCFSETYGPAKHPAPVDVWDGGRRRVFCPTRYALSAALPGIINGLPGATVFQTPEANFVRIDLRNDGLAGDYRVFFRIKRAGAAEDHQLKLVVESAYSPDEGQALAARSMSKVRFAVLVDKTLRGEKLKFHHKR